MTTNKDKLSGYFFTDKTVREDDSLSDISKLVFGDIAYFYFLGEGKCRASNSFFAKKYGKSEGTISKAISILCDHGYIKRYLDQYKNRTIFVNRSAFSNEKDESTIEKSAGGQNSLPSEIHSNDHAQPLTDETINGGQDYSKHTRFANFYNNEKSN